MTRASREKRLTSAPRSDRRPATQPILAIPARALPTTQSTTCAKSPLALALLLLLLRQWTPLESRIVGREGIVADDEGRLVRCCSRRRCAPLARRRRRFCCPLPARICGFSHSSCRGALALLLGRRAICDLVLRDARTRRRRRPARARPLRRHAQAAGVLRPARAARAAAGAEGSRETRDGRRGARAVGRRRARERRGPRGRARGRARRDGRRCGGTRNVAGGRGRGRVDGGEDGGRGRGGTRSGSGRSRGCGRDGREVGVFGCACSCRRDAFSCISCCACRRRCR